MKKIKRNHIEATKFWVEENEKGLSKTQVAELFGSDRHVIKALEQTYSQYINSANEEDKDYMFLFSSRELQAVQEYANNPTSSKKTILKKYNIGNTHTLNNWLRILGCNSERHYKYDFDRDAFRREPSEEMAYWLGFLLADGFIGKRNNKRNSIELHLGAKDKQHLVKFARFLHMKEEQIEDSIKQSIGGAYTRDNIIYRFSVFSTQMVEDVAKYNVLPNKSLQEKPYIFKDEKLQISYIRGLIDGDGYVPNPSVKQKIIGICGSKEVCSYVGNFFKQKYPDLSIPEIYFRQQSKNSTKSLWGWKTANRQAVLRITSLLYKDASIYLDRKYNNACAVLKSLNKAGTLNE